MPIKKLALMIGQVIARRYEVLSLLGQGGMARVYRARDLNLGREVAIKALLEQIASDPESKERFRREARAAAALSHPNIVQVYDFFDCSEGTFIVMELIEGEDLRTFMEHNGRMRLDDAINIALAVLAALRVAHSKGVVHRDISARNVLLGSDGLARVSDFGIARVVGEHTLNQAGDLVGSVQYISPEQARGDEVDYRADIYSLGALLFEMLSGQLPFTADNAVKMALKHIQEQPPAPSTFRPEISSSLDEIVLKAMRKNPQERYQSAEEMINALNSLRQTRPTLVLPVENALDDADSLEATVARPGLRLPLEELQSRNEPVDDFTPFSSPTLNSGVSPASIASTITLPADGLRSSIKSRTGSLEPEFVSPLRAYDRESEDELPSLAEEDIPELEEAEEEPKRLGKGWTILFVMLGAGLIGLFGSLFWATNFAQPRVEVPSVVGKSLAQAREIIEKAHLKLEVRSQKPSSTAKPGSVLEQDPVAGTKLDRDTSVFVVLCLGLETVEVPELSGMTEDQAKDELDRLGLDYLVTTEDNSEVDKGLVIRQDPPAASKITKGSKVNVFVSGGSGTIYVPDLVSMSEEAAKNAAEDIGCKLVVVGHKESREIKEGLILEQTPKAGNKVESGTELRVILSSGKPAVSVPNLVGKTVGQARSQLASLGLSLSVQGEASDLAVINDQEPAANAKATSSVVTVFIASSAVTPDTGGQVSVPNLIGMPLEDATVTLREAGLEVGSVSSVSGSGAPGSVVNQGVAAGSEVAGGSAVDLEFIGGVSEVGTPESAPTTPTPPEPTSAPLKQ